MLLLTLITKTRLFKYTENFTITTTKKKNNNKKKKKKKKTKKKKKKRENFQTKKSDIFHISAQNIDCGYSLEPPRRGGSNEYPQFMFFFLAN